MKKRTLAIVIALALAIGVATAALAAETDGSIIFESGDVVINEPGSESECGCCPKCCPCEAECEGECDCDCPCECTCPEEYGNYFFRLGVDNDLYFGSHELTVYGTFDSANKPERDSPQSGEEGYTTDAGQFTGVEVINYSAAPAKIGVEITGFTVGGSPTLAGAELTLMVEAATALGGGTPYTQEDEVKLSGSSTKILSVNSGRAVKAVWSGLLETLPGTAKPGKAQATLTWTDITGTP